MGDMTLLSALATLLSEISGWPLVTLLIFFIAAPPLLLIYVLRNLIVAVISLRDEVRSGLSTQKNHYDNNVELVKNYESLAGELVSIVRVNTSTSTQLADLIRHFLGRN